MGFWVRRTESMTCKSRNRAIFKKLKNALRLDFSNFLREMRGGAYIRSHGVGERETGDGG